MKLLVPAGYMIGQGARVLSVEMCADAQGQKMITQLVLPGTGQPEKGHQNGKADGTCPFAGLSFSSASNADPALLALALIFVLSLGFVPVSHPRLAQTHFLRPPLRGPPALV